MENEEFEKKIQSQPPTKVTKTWFIERENGEVFAINEKGAWDLLYNQNRNNLYHHKYKIVGVSDGRTYVETIRNSQNLKQELTQKVAELSRDTSRYISTLDRFKFEELLPDDDEKVVRAKALIKENEDKLEKLQEDLNNIDKTILKKAFDAEFAVAEGNIEKPQNADIKTPGAGGGSREKILRSLGR